MWFDSERNVFHFSHPIVVWFNRVFSTLKSTHFQFETTLESIPLFHWIGMNNIYGVSLKSVRNKVFGFSMDWKQKKRKQFLQCESAMAKSTFCNKLKCFEGKTTTLFFISLHNLVNSIARYFPFNAQIVEKKKKKLKKCHKFQLFRELCSPKNKVENKHKKRRHRKQ